ncbi:NAD-dependent protein deacetylase Sirt6-like isoform X2 [Ruditapes philippinarum]|uniref:NAD-dependent protein deacetylase Sirt6-like isoform X2 n=1 Tax=Ruditapes philippinarum TaxID=129788 RepID=UPI00295B84B7|nr:NAD-dependent protein deacetylase Sirt6-like isoform X2 [Ruditapes philippinarum]
MMNMSQNGKICCYRRCDEKEFLDDRIEIKTVFPKPGFNKKLKEEFLVKWHSNGEAEFHVDCWEKVYMISRSRPNKKLPYMPKEERELVETASDAFEQFDSNSKVLQEAKKAAEWIKCSDHCVAFTGAGISTSAGIGDYRGKAGKWTEDDQNRAVSIATDKAGTETDDEPPAKKMKPGRSMDSGIQYENLRPTYSHEALYKLMESGYLKGVISQNCDGLHGLSGIPDDKLCELHGNVFIEVCEKCGHRYHRKFYVMDDVGSQYFEEIEDFGKSCVKKPKFAVQCELCGLSHRTGRKCDNKKCKGNLNDTIINFRDNLEGEILERARTHSRRSDLMLCLGTTLQVTPAANLVGKRKDRRRLIICNRQETALDSPHQKKGANGADNRCRVFGDCDVFMREVMRHLYTEEDLKTWEAARQERMKKYDTERDPV